MRLAPALLLALGLAACKPAAEEPAPAPPPAPPEAAAPAAPRPIQGDLNALGTEPFWALEIRATTLKFTRPDAPDIVTPNPGPRLDPSKAVWPAQGLVVTLTEGQCSDGMSDRTYPFFAEVTAGIDMFKGCATKASALKPANQ
jgi:uncharacterized membrane protein